MTLHKNDARKIGFVESIRYLGVNMSMDMNFRVYVNNLRRRVSGTVGKLRRVMRKDWGLKKSTVSVLVKGLLTPAVIHGASAWYSLTLYKGVREELNRCHRRVLYACIRVCRTVSTEVMQVILGSLPWDIECVRLANLYKLRKRLVMNALDLVTDVDLHAERSCYS